MKQFKRIKVVMLSTENKSIIVLTGKKLVKINESNYNFSHIKSQHLYIITDDEIKEGDWFIVLDGTNSIRQCKSISLEYIDFEGGFCTKPSVCKKIIATTDTSLLIDTYINQGDTVKGDLIIKRGSDYTTGLKGRINLPQPSKQFIQKFVEEYNKNNIITDVLVEYEPGYVNPEWNKEKLKINPKDNTITIKKVKDSWNREEVIELLTKLNHTLDIGSNRTFEEWIEENL